MAMPYVHRMSALFLAGAGAYLVYYWLFIADTLICPQAGPVCIRDHVPVIASAVAFGVDTQADGARRQSAVSRAEIDKKPILCYRNHNNLGPRIGSQGEQGETEMLLAGDIGGTKTNLALFAPEDGLIPQAQATFKSADYPSLEAVVAEFLADAGASVDRAVFGVAGPVVDGQSTATNLPWVISEAVLQEALGLGSQAAQRPGGDGLRCPPPAGR